MAAPKHPVLYTLYMSDGTVITLEGVNEWELIDFIGKPYGTLTVGPNDEHITNSVHVMYAKKG